MPTKTRKIPVRHPEMTTLTWSLPKRLKAMLLVIAENNGRTTTSHLNFIVAPLVEKEFHQWRKADLTDKQVEEILDKHAERAYRGIPYTAKDSYRGIAFSGHRS